MENFVVLARKYRPQNFDEVVGQAHITTTLKNSIKNNRLAHAFLFSGPRGVGKTTCARILAKTINCENRNEEGEACNECTSCKTFLNGQSLNIYELDAASNNSVDDIRELNEQVRYAPQGGKYKVYIIDEVHMLSQAAFNAFLKTLEEPPEHVIFIMATTEKQKILPTILSRCQVFDFKRMSTEETVGHLLEISKKEGFDAENDALHLIAQKSEGCMRDALSIMDKLISFTGGKLTYKNTLEHLNILDYDYFFKITEAFQKEDPGEALLIFDEILEKGFEGEDFLDGYSEFIRDILVGKDSRSIALMEVAESLKARYKDLAKKTDTGFLVSALNILNKTGIQYKQARNKRLLVEMCLIKLTYLRQAVALISDEKTGSVSKKKVINNRVAAPVRAPFIPPGRKKKAVQERVPKETVEVAEKQVQTVETDEVREPEPGRPEPEDMPSKEQRKTVEVISSPAATGILDLGSIRKKIKENKKKNGKKEKKEILDLEEEKVNQLWSEHIKKLKKVENKNQAANLLGLATLRIISEDEIEIACRNSVQKSFIEDQKIAFAEVVKAHFNNRAIKVSLRVDDSLRKSETKEILTNRQKLENMIEKYPIVKELKDKLNLDLG